MMTSNAGYITRHHFSLCVLVLFSLLLWWVFFCFLLVVVLFFIDVLIVCGRW